MGVFRRAASNQVLARLLGSGLAKGEQFIFEALNMGLRLTMTMRENSLLGAILSNCIIADEQFLLQCPSGPTLHTSTLTGM